MNIKKYIIKNDLTIREALIALNNLSNDTLTLFVVDEKDALVGTLTDGDIRRKLINNGSLNDSVSDTMHMEYAFIYAGKIDLKEIIRIKNLGVCLIPCLDASKRIVDIYDLNKIKSILPVDAVLMAGGKGERLRPLTEKTPKPLLPVGDKAIIDYNIDTLITFGIKHISVTVNYLGEQIVKHFNDVRNGIKINCVKEPSYLGTIGSIKFIKEFHNDTVLLMNSDLFTNLNYEDFYLHFLRNDADMSVASVPYSHNIPYGIFELDGRVVQGVKEKPTYNYYANGGIYLIKKKLLELMPENVFFNATDFIELLISKNYKVIRFPIAGYWIDIGKHEEYRKAQELVKHIN